MSEWRKIDKEWPDKEIPTETPVLIWDGRIRCVAELEVKRDRVHYLTKEIMPAWIWWTCVGAGGWECENDFDTPTHWMPLPAPPK